MRYVIAGNYSEYRQYCQDHRLNPYCDATYVRDAQHLYGLHKPNVIFIGRWAHRKDIGGINDALVTRDATVTYE